MAEVVVPGPRSLDIDVLPVSSSSCGRTSPSARGSNSICGVVALPPVPSISAQELRREITVDTILAALECLKKPGSVEEKSYAVPLVIKHLSGEAKSRYADCEPSIREREILGIPARAAAQQLTLLPQKSGAKTPSAYRAISAVPWQIKLVRYWFRETFARFAEEPRANCCWRGRQRDLGVEHPTAPCAGPCEQ